MTTPATPTTLTNAKDWHVLSVAQQLEHLGHVESALILLQRQIPNYPNEIHRLTPPKAWAALTDEQQFALITELEMQRNNHRDYLNQLCRPAAAAVQAGCRQRASLQEACV